MFYSLGCFLVGSFAVGVVFFFGEGVCGLFCFILYFGGFFGCFFFFLGCFFVFWGVGGGFGFLGVFFFFFFFFLCVVFFGFCGLFFFFFFFFFGWSTLLPFGL